MNASGAPAIRGYAHFAIRMIALFAALGVILVIVAVQVYRTVGDLVDEGGMVAHTHRVKEQIVATVAVLRDAEAAQRAYFLGGDTSRLAGYYAALPKLKENLDGLRSIVADNPDQMKAADDLGVALEARRDLMTTAIAAFQDGGLDTLRGDKKFAMAREQDAEVDTIMARMLAIEDKLLVDRQATSVASASLTRLLTVSAIALCFVMLAIALVVILREQRRRLVSEHRAIASYGELARSLEESRRLGDTLRQLSDLGEMLQGCRNLDEAAVGLQVALANLFPATSGALNLINASQNLVAPMVGWGTPSASDSVFAPDDCWALRRGRPYPEVGAPPAFTCKHLGDDPDRDVRSTVCVPLIAQGAMFGTLVIAAEGPIATETRGAATAAAEQISLAIANLRLQETLRTQSLRDPITSLFNRRYLEVSLARDLAQAIRRSQPLAVLMLDIDHFKSFNDTYGHDAGDALLARFGELLASLARSEDVACRYGGEEFTMVLQETDAGLALDRAEEIRRAASRMEVQHRRQALKPVTVSIGIASYPLHGDTPEQLLRRSDRALYAAKHGGRDRVCVADGA